MNRAWRLFVSLSLLSLAQSGASCGQPGPGADPHSAHLQVYNPDTVVTVSGVVVSVTPPPAQPGWPYQVYLILRTAAGQVSVYLAPNLYVRKLAVQLKPLDQIQVTGSRVMEAKKPVILAAEVKKGDQVLPFRRPDGVPYWRQRGRN